MGPLGVAGLAEDVAVERVAAVAVVLGRQLQITIFAPVTVHVEAPVQGDHANGLLFARLGDDGLLAGAAPGRELLVIVLDTVDLAVRRHREGHVVEHLGANLAPETVWMVGLSGGPQNAVDDGPVADAALF